MRRNYQIEKKFSCLLSIGFFEFIQALRQPEKRNQQMLGNMDLCVILCNEIAEINE